jgi:outer membrane receptor protein involved in Fe transport
MWGLASVTVVLLACSSTWPQLVSQAQLNGYVRDQNGGVLAKAPVTLRNVDTNQAYKVSSNENGAYVFTNLPPGNYELTAEFAGFSRYTRTKTMLSVGQIATIDITLKVAAREERVEVNTDTPVIEPTRSEITQVIDTEQIQSLPISGRLFTDFALLSPGVSTGRTGLQSTFTDPTTTRISFGGQRDLNNGVTVDGADNISTITASQRATPSQEAVNEFRVVNNSFGAEYGRALGGIVNVVTKSGSNALHGSVYDYLQNNATNAKTVLTLPGFNTLRQNQFGGTLGGPIIKDKSFFFVNYEGQRRAESPTYPALLVSSLPAINALKTDLGLAPENLNILKTVDYNEGLIKVDHRLNDKNTLSARYSIEDSTALNMLVGNTLDGGGIGAPSSGRNGLLRDQALVGTLTTQLSNTLVNSALVQWARRNYGFPGVTGQPDLEVPNLLLFGHNFGAFDRYNESRVQISDSLSWVKGKHVAKFGFDSNYVQNYVISAEFTPARIIFPSLGDLLVSGKSNWASTPCPPPLVGLVSPCTVAFLWNGPIGHGPFNPNAPSPPVPTTWQNAYNPSELPNFEVRANHSYWGFFAQDQYRITPKLTVNYGLRYDFESGLGYWVKPDYREFQPRLGVAYSPNSKTVVRAGYGIFYDKYNLTFFYVVAPQRPPVIPGLALNNNQQQGTWLLNALTLPTPCVLPGCPTPPPGAPLPPGTVPPPLVASAFENLITSGQFPNNALYSQGGGLIDRNMRAPYSQQASLGIDHDLGKGFSVSVAYLWVAAHKLLRSINLNTSDPIAKETGTNKDIYAFGLLVPSIPAPPGGSPGTNGVFAFFDSTGNTAYNGVTITGSQRASAYLRFTANYTFSKTLDDGTYATFVSLPQSNAQRNLERALSNQDVRHRFVGNFIAAAPQSSFLRNFEFSSIVTLQSPRPFTLFVGFDANNDGNPVTDRVGTVGRNTYQGDGLRTVDFRLSRTIHLTESRKLALMADVFNVFNRSNVDEVFSVYGAPNFIGPVPRQFNDGVGSPANPAFGAPRTVFNPRQFQFAAKFIF